LNCNQSDNLMEISKRDYFAAQALTGMLAHPGGLGDATRSPEAAALEAFHYADAMLKLSKTLMAPVEIDPELLNKPVVPSAKPLV
jgi:hypothetical protein